jgi:hypothetical protein
VIYEVPLGAHRCAVHETVRISPEPEPDWRLRQGQKEYQDPGRESHRQANCRGDRCEDEQAEPDAAVCDASESCVAGLASDNAASVSERHGGNPRPREDDGDPESEDTPAGAGPAGHTDETKEKNRASDARENRPGAFMLRPKPTSEYTAASDQRGKAECGSEDMQQTVPADRVGIGWRAGRKTERRISCEHASADEAEAVACEQQRSPDAAPTRVECSPQAHGASESRADR